MKVWSLMLLSVLVCPLAHIPEPAQARQSNEESAEYPRVLDGLGELARHRAYPYVERAQRAVAQGELEVAIEHWRAALERAPGHAPIIRALAETLLAADRPAAADELLEAGPENDELKALKQQARLDWLADSEDPPSVERWLEWLASASNSDARALIDGYAFSDREDLGLDGKLTGLSRVPCPGNGCIHAIERRIVMAESAGRWAHVIDALQQLKVHRRWTSEDQVRAVSAWVAQGDWGALEQWLLEEQSAQHADLIRMAIQNAIGQSEWGVARRLLEALQSNYELRADEASQLEQVYVELGELERAAELTRTRGECLRAVAQLIEAGLAGKAHEWLGECKPGPAGVWLDLAIELEALDLLIDQRFDQSGPEGRRIEAIAVLMQRRGEDEELISLLRGHQHPVAREYLLAALEREEHYEQAAEIVRNRYQSTGSRKDLERASYFYLLADERKKAARLLVESAPFGDDELGRQLSRRLLTLYPLPEVDPEAAAAIQVVANTSDPDLRIDGANTLHSTGRCADVRDLGLVPSGSRAGEVHLLLGFCLQQEAPGLAVHHFGQADRLGIARARGPLAVSLFESGRPEEALDALERLESDEGLAPDQYRLKVEAALEAGRYSAAAEAHAQLGDQKDDRQWWSMRARTAQGLGQFEQALQWWTIVEERWHSSEATFQIGVLHHELGDFEAAVNALGRAVERDPDNAKYLSEYAYAMERVDSRRSVAVFEQALRHEPWRYELHEQLGYVHARLKQGEPARAAFRRAIDRLRPELPPPDLDPQETRKRSYLVRRSHEALGRRWRVEFSAWAATNSVPGEFFLAEDPPRNYANLIVDRQLGADSGLGSIHARARLIGQGSSDDPLSDRAVTLGMTWHLPLGKTVVGVDWLEPENGTGEFLVHAASEWLSDGRYRRDWRPETPSWQERRFYVEGAWWARSDAYLVSARFDHAWHFAVDDWRATSWYPYLLAESRLVRSGHDVRVGAGIGLRKWSGESRYDAHRRVHSLRLEFQHAVETNIADRNGVFLRLESAW